MPDLDAQFNVVYACFVLMHTPANSQFFSERKCTTKLDFSWFGSLFTPSSLLSLLLGETHIRPITRPIKPVWSPPNSPIILMRNKRCTHTQHPLITTLSVVLHVVIWCDMMRDMRWWCVWCVWGVCLRRYCWPVTLPFSSRESNTYVRVLCCVCVSRVYFCGGCLSVFLFFLIRAKTKFLSDF